MMDALAAKAHRKELAFDFLFDAGVPSMLSGDPGRVRQILTNLVGNAIKFTEKGSVQIKVSLKEEWEETVRIRFEVIDTGIGIDLAQQHQLFLPFTQADASITRRFGGTGLGLSICHRLVDLLGGEMGVESCLHEGSVFWFELPFVKRAVSDLFAIPPEELKGKRVMLVDCNSLSSQSVANMLADFKMECALFSEAGVAWEQLVLAANDKTPFDVVIMDMKLGKMNGEDLGRKIKSDPLVSQTGLLMMTAFGRRGDVARLQKVGFSGYLTKPVKKRTLRECLIKILTGEEGRQQKTVSKMVTRFSVEEARKESVRILIADDNEINLMMLQKMIERFGYYADTAVDGCEVIDKITKRHYDLLVLDLEMPRMDGFETARQIRSGETGSPNHDLPIIAFTGHVHDAHKNRCMRVGMNDFLVKPVHPQLLLEKLEFWLFGQKQTHLKIFDTSEGQDKAAHEILPSVEPFAPSKKALGASPSHPLGEVFDEQDVLNRLDDDKKLIAQLMQVYCRDTELQLGTLKALMGQSDWPEHVLDEAFHKIKGISGNVGSRRMMNLAAEIESALKEANKERVRDLFTDMVEVFAEFKQEIVLKGYSDKGCQH
jgi:CheY-like chemotaxis protein